MLAAIGEHKRFHDLDEEQKASIFRAMFNMRDEMAAYKRLADGREARTLERGPGTFQLALHRIVKMRHSDPVFATLLRM